MTFHRAPRPVSLAVMALILLSADLPLGSAQSLGEVASREAERRKQATSGRVYTNGDLAPVDPSVPSPAPIPVEAATGSGGEAPNTPAPRQEIQPAKNGGVESVIVKAREKRDEPYWRAMAKDLRGGLAKTTAEIAATEARLSEIDAGPQTPTVVKEREVLAVTLSKLQQTARYRSEEMTRFLTRAQVSKVPEEWFR